MAPSLQELIDYLLAEIALCGDQGRSFFFFFFWSAASLLQDVNPFRSVQILCIHRPPKALVLCCFVFPVLYMKISEFTMVNKHQAPLYLIF